MPKVLVLPDHIASQIAAGEVIERPASVVKELIENSIDAAATQIEIAIASECRDIRVADNGCGMDPEDAVLAFARHATSKISSADDLWSLRSMGFRGEALASVCSIAKVTCLTRTAETQNGTKVEAAEGKITTSQTGCAPGTVMEINDLFYNVPARLKFLKKPATEFAYIHEIVQSLAVAFPKITFHLLNNGQTVLRTSGTGKLAQAMVEAGLLNGKEELCQVTYAELTHGMAIYGYVARPVHFRGDRKGILSIVNNRPVRCPLTYKALDYAYSDLIPKGKYPIGVLTITADPKMVDVNVHPTKKEIKYSNGNDVYVAIQRAVSDALRARQPEDTQADGSNGGGGNAAQAVYSAVAPSEPLIQVSEGKAPESAPVRQQVTKTTQQLRLERPAALIPGASALSPVPVPLRTRLAASLPEGWALLGYLKNTYFLMETPEGLEIIEQHIAHERVLYEKLLSSQETAGRLSESSQRLVISVPLNLTPEQQVVLRENLQSFQKIGFDFDFPEPDAGAVVCTQVPLELAHKDYATVVQGIIQAAAVTDKADLQLEATKSVACQSAIKNGMPLAEQDIVQLISDWSKTERNDTCPHGRPIRLKFSMDKLFQLFHPA